MSLLNTTRNSKNLYKPEGILSREEADRVVMINPKSARNLNNLRTNILEFVRAFMALYISILHTNTLQELDKLYTM